MIIQSIISMKKIAITAFAFLFACGVQAQGLFGVSYDVSLGMGEQSDFVGPASFRGVTLEGRWFLNQSTSLGISAAWHVFYEDAGEESFADGTVTATGRQYRYINTLPLLLNGHYYTGVEGDTRFYFGGGIGLSSIDQRTDIGLYQIDHSHWHFTVAPEVGVMVPLSYFNSLLIAAKYHYSPKADDSIDFSYLSLRVGFTFSK
jgi:outer membrane protein